MQYVHRLQDLNPKSMDIESIPLIRIIKQETVYPISEESLNSHFSSFFPSYQDREAMKQALIKIETAINLLTNLIAKKEIIYEKDNILRSIKILQEMPEALNNNLRYHEEISIFQEEFMKKATSLLNQIPSLRTNEERFLCNQELERYFQVLLRTKNFYFNSEGIVSESHLNHIKGLTESLDKGYLFHLTVGEEIDKIPFSKIRLRIPQNNLAESESIYDEVVDVKKGVEQAYNFNMCIVHWTIHLFSYIKWLGSKNI